MKRITESAFRRRTLIALFSTAMVAIAPAAQAETITLQCSLDNMFVIDLAAKTVTAIGERGARFKEVNVAISDGAFSFRENVSMPLLYRTFKIDRATGAMEIDNTIVDPQLWPQYGHSSQQTGQCTKIPNQAS